MPHDPEPRGDLIWGSIPGLVADAAERFGAAEALVDRTEEPEGALPGVRGAEPPDEMAAHETGRSGGTRLSFSALRAASDQAARAAMAAGVAKGDRVAIWAPNCWEWVVAALGVLSAGGVLVPINTRFKGAEAAHVLERSGAELVFCVSDFLDIDYVGMLRAELDAPVKMVVLRGSVPDGTTSWQDFVNEAEQVSLADAHRRARSIAPSDLSDIMFTSGTTGRPKGVMTTHGQTLRTFEVWSRLVGLAEGDRYLIVNPFFHTFGYKAGFIACLMRGATILPHPVFDVGQVLERIADEGVSMLPGPPTLYQSILAADTSGLDLSSLRLAVTGAAVVPVELVKRMRNELTFSTVLTAYGLTEATGVVTMCREGDDAETIATTSGRAIPDIEVRIVDDEHEELPRGEPGEIVVRGYNVMRGYYQDREATQEAIDPGGWLHTGDIGVMDEHGYVRITDRKKDMFIVGGFNAYPAEIENDLVSHPAVAQAAVVGVPDERMGEVGHAFVVPRPGEEIDTDELLAWARERMANYKVPRAVEVVDSLPLNASGKVLKYQLREKVVKA